ncbi:MAG: hypothetical protein M1817_003359 [Caeruleum heppii]|nr:MAG: hypothetical protein M1817_003359 [Caeruleum heppii]
MPPKRPPQGSPASETPNAKHVKTELTKPEDFSNSVKKRLASSTRTGQACDRCKIRKIRCDGLLGGCSPCLQNHTECRTTDRITGRATSRGYVEGLEQENHNMKGHIHTLEARLMSMGVDIKPSYHDANSAPTMDWASAGINNGSQTWATPSSPSSTGNVASMGSHRPSLSRRRTEETNIFRALPVFRTGCTGDNYLGVSSGNSYLSSIKGTALSVLGMEIDVADFSSEDLDEPAPSSFQPELYNKSYQSYLQSAFNVNPKIDKVDLPPRDEGLTYAQWYLRVLNPYLPVLHKPSFMNLLHRIYHEPDFRPTPAETVMVHMVFAIMFFQYAARNWENAEQQAELNARSNQHYHYSLNFFYQLCSSHTLQDVQALTMICSHLRNFPKPGASWMVANTALTIAIELGLHRSAKRWVQMTPQKNVLEIEMRKRVFWSLISIHVTLSGKLGRPMPLRLDDFDVELPEAYDDELLTEDGYDGTTAGKCAHRIGIEAFKVLPVFIELFSTLYAVKRNPQTYVGNVKRLEHKIKMWKDQWPTELLQESAENEQEGRVFSLYVQIWALEFRLLLRHPSISLTTSAEFNNESLNVCVESARAMLQIVTQLQKYKSLDTTWYQGAVYLMAITTTLFAQWEKKDEINAGDLSNLRDEMDQWLSIMGDVGGLLGSGDRLKEAVRVVTDGTLGMLSRALTTNANASQHRSRSRSPPAPSNGNPNGNAYHGYNPSMPQEPNGASHPSVNGTSRNSNGHTNSGYLPQDQDPNLTNSHAHHPYPAATQYTYPEPSTASAMTYPAQGNVYTDAAYPALDGSMPSNALPTTSTTHPNATPHQQANFNLFASAATPDPTTSAAAAAIYQAQAASAAAGWNPGSQSWRQWTGTMTNHLEPQDCYSASALMQLGGRALNAAVQDNNAMHGGHVSGPMTAPGAPVADMGAAVSAAGGMPGTNGAVGVSMADGAGNGPVPGQAPPWPLMIFDIGHGAAS